MTSDPKEPTVPPRQASFGSHDDPVVVDNGPARVDFGNGQHEPKEENGVIRRAFTRFSRMLTLIVKNGKVEGRAEVHDLAADKPIRFHLEDGQKTGALTFAIEAQQGKDGDLVVTPSGDFTFRLDGREMKHRNHDPRVIKITQGDKTLRSAEDQPKNRVLVAVLLATPEVKEQERTPAAAPDRSGERGASAVRTTLMLAFVAAIALLGYRIFEGSRGSHDDPIVVDNGPITIVKGNANPAQKGTPKQWTIHHSDQLRLLYAFTQATDGAAWRSLEQPIPLSGVKNITFDLVEAGQPKATEMTIFRDRWYEALVPKAHLDAKIDFTKQGKALTPADQKYRVGQVWVEDQPVCLVDTDRPVTTKCASWAQKPFRVKVLICSRADKCDSYFPSTQ